MLGDGAEVAGAGEDDHLVEVVLAVDAVVHAQARVPEGRRQRLREVVAPVIEQARVEGEGVRDALLDEVDRDGPIEVQAQVKQLDLEGQALVAPDRARRLEADVAVRVVVELEQVFGHALFRRPVGLLREAARDGAHGVEIEARRRVGARGGGGEQRGAEPRDALAVRGASTVLGAQGLRDARSRRPSPGL